MLIIDIGKLFKNHENKRILPNISLSKRILENMKAFISYSHSDGKSLEVLHKHLAQLKRDDLISTWTDNEIPAGGLVDNSISYELDNSNLFIALLSADYIASNYCYEKEFNRALIMQEKGKIIIVPVVLEPCDWLSTPFKKFKALPKDGKPVNTWENRNNAFLDVIQNIRKLIDTSRVSNDTQASKIKSSSKGLSRNYRVQKDFDSIQKLEFVEKTFKEVVEQLKRNIQEITELENIKSRVIHETNKDFECLLVNRNKINTESNLKLSIGNNRQHVSYTTSSELNLSYSIDQDNRNNNFKSFNLSFNEYNLFWDYNDFYSSLRNRGELSSKEIIDIIWNEWLESVGII